MRPSNADCSSSVRSCASSRRATHNQLARYPPACTAQIGQSLPNIRRSAPKASSATENAGRRSSTVQGCRSPSAGYSPDTFAKTLGWAAARVIISAHVVRSRPIGGLARWSSSDQAQIRGIAPRSPARARGGVRRHYHHVEREVSLLRVPPRPSSTLLLTRRIQSGSGRLWIRTRVRPRTCPAPCAKPINGRIECGWVVQWRPCDDARDLSVTRRDPQHPDSLATASSSSDCTRSTVGAYHCWHSGGGLNSSKSTIRSSSGYADASHGYDTRSGFQKCWCASMKSRRHQFTARLWHNGRALRSCSREITKPMGARTA